MQNSMASPPEEKSFLSVIVHSFFIIPFLIAVFCVLVFSGVHLLTREKKTAYDYLQDISTGSLTKRWQGAFELSKILSNPIPIDAEFKKALVEAFEKAKHDDPRVRQYLALAIGRTGAPELADPLLRALAEESQDNLAANIYALGLLQESSAVPQLIPYVTHGVARVRSMAVVALGSIGDPQARSVLQGALQDQEANVRWGAAMALAKMGDASGKEILLKMLDGDYWAAFQSVDAQEKLQLMLAAIEYSVILKDPELMKKISRLAQSDENMKVRNRAMLAMRQ